MIRNLSAKLRFVKDFLSSYETNECDFKLDLYYEHNRKNSDFGDRFGCIAYCLLTYWNQKREDKAIHFSKD